MSPLGTNYHCPQMEGGVTLTDSISNGLLARVQTKTPRWIPSLSVCMWSLLIPWIYQRWITMSLRPRWSSRFTSTWYVEHFGLFASWRGQENHTSSWIIFRYFVAWVHHLGLTALPDRPVLIPLRANANRSWESNLRPPVVLVNGNALPDHLWLWKLSNQSVITSGHSKLQVRRSDCKTYYGLSDRWG